MKTYEELEQYAAELLKENDRLKEENEELKLEVSRLENQIQYGE